MERKQRLQRNTVSHNFEFGGDETSPLAIVNSATTLPILAKFIRSELDITFFFSRIFACYFEDIPALNPVHPQAEAERKPQDAKGETDYAANCVALASKQRPDCRADSNLC